MQRKLILPVKDYNQKKVEMEIEIMKRLLPYIESFKTFFINYDVFDIYNHRLVKRWKKIKNAFYAGFTHPIKYYAFCKN